jgi:hypothetical protein
VTRLLMTVRIQSAEEAQAAEQRLEQQQAELRNVDYRHADFGEAAGRLPKATIRQSIALALQQAAVDEPAAAQPIRRFGEKVGAQRSLPLRFRQEIQGSVTADSPEAIGTTAPDRHRPARRAPGDDAMTLVADPIAPLRDFVTAYDGADRPNPRRTHPAARGPFTAVEPAVARRTGCPTEFAEPAPDTYRQYLLHCDPLERFSVVSFVWGPGHRTPIHDHTVWDWWGCCAAPSAASSTNGRATPSAPPAMNT